MEHVALGAGAKIEEAIDALRVVLPAMAGARRTFFSTLPGARRSFSWSWRGGSSTSISARWRGASFTSRAPARRRAARLVGPAHGSARASPGRGAGQQAAPLGDDAARSVLEGDGPAHRHRARGARREVPARAGHALYCRIRLDFEAIAPGRRPRSTRSRRRSAPRSRAGRGPSPIAASASRSAGAAPGGTRTSRCSTRSIAPRCPSISSAAPVPAR